MNKVATYLRSHISGEVATRADIRRDVGTDGGILEMVPDMVIYPRNTNDIRKACRFSWQLAEKGHALPITVRGAGTDTTGSSIGKGMVLVTTEHMNQIFEYDAKQRLVRLQPGVTTQALTQALALQGTTIHAVEDVNQRGTIGGAIANASAGLMAGKYGTIERAVDQLEVVLANGDVIQTGRLPKREFERKKGLQGFEGDIYRGVDTILEEYDDLFDSLNSNDATGYNAIADVKQKDGSIDLTPLFVGSQGTLGIVSEMILRTEYRSMHTDVVALVFANENAARDALDTLCNMSPAVVDYFDAELFETAKKSGKSYPFYATASESFTPESVVIVVFDEFSERHRQKRVKRIEKHFQQMDGVSFAHADSRRSHELLDAVNVTYYAEYPDHDGELSPRIFEGFHIPTARLEDFTGALKDLSTKYHLALPLAGHAATNTYGIYPILKLKSVSDKQKIFKLLDELTKLVYAHSGTMIAEGGEGRLKTPFVYQNLDTRVVGMYEAIRTVFDPHGTLNPGVKSKSDMRSLVSILRAYT